MARPIFNELLSGLMDYIYVLIFMAALPICILLYRLVHSLWKRRQQKGVIESPYEAFYKNESESFREALHQYLATSRFSGWWLLFQVIVTFISVGQYIVETYQHQDEARPPFLAMLELFSSLMFTVDFLLFFFASPDRLKYCLTPLAITDQLTVLPVYVALVRGTFWIATNSFLRPLRVIRAGRISQVYRLLSLSQTSVQRQMVTVILTITVVIFFGAAVIQIVEAIGSNGQTFTTVGYGDYTPRTTQGQMVMVVMILVGFLMVSYQSGRLINLLSSRSAYEGSYKANVLHPHIVICGDITYNSMVYFFKELFHQSRQAEKLRVVLLSRKEPSLALKMLLEHPFYTRRVWFLVGSVLTVEDQRRASLSEAIACFVINNKFRAEDPDADAEIILRALAVKEHSSDVPVVAQLHRKRNMQYLRDGGIDVIVPMDEIKMLILGQNCMAPGFSTLISNLVHTFSPRQNDASSRHSWAEEYYKGCTNQFYNIQIPAKFEGVSFTTLVKLIYDATKSILFAIHTENPDTGEPLTLLNPGSAYYISGGEIGIVIATYEANSRLHEIIDELSVPTDDLGLSSSQSDTDIASSSSVLLRRSGFVGQGRATPTHSPLLSQSSSGALFRKVKRRTNKNGRSKLQRSDLGLFIEVDDSDDPAAEVAAELEEENEANLGSRESESEFEEEEEEDTRSNSTKSATPSKKSKADQHHLRKIAEIDRGSPRFRQPRRTKPKKPTTIATLSSDEDTEGASPIQLHTEVIETADTVPGGMKRPTRSLSSGPRNVTDESDVLRTIGTLSRQSRILEEPSTPLPDEESTPAHPRDSNRPSGRTSLTSRSEISKDSDEPVAPSPSRPRSVQFNEPSESSTTARAPLRSGPNPGTEPKKLSLGDRLKMIRTQKEGRDFLAPSSEAPALRRASIDIERPLRDSSTGIQNGSALSEDQTDSYAQTVSTDQPFARELARLRAEFRKSEFKREKFDAQITESLHNILFEQKAVPRKQSVDTPAPSLHSSSVPSVSENYYLLPTPRKRKDFVVTGKDYMFTHSDPHILICGESSRRSFIHLITPMRSSKLGASRLLPIVFLHVNLPSAYELKMMSQYPEVYFVEGSMLSDFDLRRAGIKNAKAVVLLTTQDRGGADGRVEKHELVDSNVIFAFRNIHLNFPSVDLVFGEMAEGPNMRFLDVGQLLKERASRLKRGLGVTNTLVQVMKETRNSVEWISRPNVSSPRRWTSFETLTNWFASPLSEHNVLEYPEYHFRPLFAGGHVWAASMVDSLFAQILYNPALLNVVRLLAGGSPDPAYWSKSSNVFQIPIPSQSHGFRGRTFQDLFLFFVEQDCIPLALYRSHASSQCDIPYVYTNPEPETQLEPTDRVFVVSLSDPADLSA